MTLILKYYLNELQLQRIYVEGTNSKEFYRKHRRVKLDLK
jgi:hypothetical protein